VCTVKLCDILTVKNALVKSLYCVTECAVCNSVLTSFVVRYRQISRTPIQFLSHLLPPATLKPMRQLLIIEPSETVILTFGRVPK